MTRIAHLAAAAAGLAALGLATPPAARAQAAAADTSARLATVSVETARPGVPIARDFIGYSLEVTTAGQGIGAFQGGAAAGAAASAEEAVYALGHPGAPNAGYFRLMRNLGAGILRLGGNSQDNSCWARAQAPHPDGCAAELTGPDLRLFGEAARASGWKLIVGLNLKQNAPAWAVREVTEGVAREIPRPLVLALEPGNEPDLFFRTPYRATGYAAADGAKEFLAYARALRADAVGRRYPVVGPATCCGWRNPGDLATFVDSVGRANLAFLTVHNYSETTCNGRQVSVARLLSPELMDQFNREAKPLAALARERHLAISMAETNSASCGGMPGVSNAFASALWGLDYAFSLADDGYAGVAFHTSYRPGGGSSYNPVDTYGQRDSAGKWSYRNVAEPLYYALYLFGRHASGARLLPATIETRGNVRAWAARRCAACAVDVFVLNKDSSASGPVRVHLGRKMGDGTLLLLAAPSLGSLAPDVRLGGVQFASDGSIGEPVTVAVDPDASGDYTFVLPNAAIALLTVEPAGRR